MADCELFVGGCLAIAIGILFFFLASRERFRIRLAASLPLSSCGALEEGIVQVTGRATGSQTVTSPLSGVPCLIASVKIELHQPHSKKRKWREAGESYKAVPFYVEDASGQVLVDPTDAEFHSGGTIKFSTQKRWRPSRRERELLQHLGVHVSELELRLRLFYAKLWGEIIELPPEMRTKLGGVASAYLIEQTTIRGVPWEKAVARTATLRSSEDLLRPGDPVSVIGPAMQHLPGEGSSEPISIQKGHPSNPLIIGKGTPAELLKSIRKKARDATLIGIGCLLVGAGMLTKCYYDSRVPVQESALRSSAPEAIGHMIVYHADRLHEGIADRGSDEVEPTLAQVLAQGVGLLCPRRELPQTLPVVLLRAPAYELPDVSIEAAEFLLDFQKSLGILDRCRDFQAVPHDAIIAQ